MAGLLAARVLSDHYERVTIVERDELPEGSEHRPGVPQARHPHGMVASAHPIAEWVVRAHTHGMLACGARIVERLMPGIIEELMPPEAPADADALRMGRWFNNGVFA